MSDPLADRLNEILPRITSDDFLAGKGLGNEEEKLAQVFVQTAQPDQHDLVLVSGVGSVWPLMRAHSLLTNLHPRMGKTPLVMFYPGRYDGQFLRLFGKLKNSNYYRAFPLAK